MNYEFNMNHVEWATSCICGWSGNWAWSANYRVRSIDYNYKLYLLKFGF